MRVTLAVVGGEEHAFDVEEATYADLLAEVDLSPNEVAVLVDGRPVPEDRAVEPGRARVLRLVSGGAAPVTAGARGRTPAPRPRRWRGRSPARRPG